VRAGTCSWTDPTLVKGTEWYPKRSMSAAERLAFYASHFPVVEADSTYYHPPSKALAEGWAERTPPGFTMDVKAWSLLTGHPTKKESVWEDLREELDPESAGKRNVYASHLPDDAVDEAWRRFAEALDPLREAGRLGAVLMQYPEWFTPRRSNREELATIRDRLGGYQLCVEFRNAAWLATDTDRERTLGLLRDLDLPLVCVDMPQGFRSSVPPIAETTSPALSVVRFHGRDPEAWTKKTVTERFRYLYSEKELAEWVPKVEHLAESAGEVHALMNNCFRDQAVTNARQLADLLSSADVPVAAPGA
jgi:uncharacterized protein YecE (DUF72 family)